MLKNIFAGSSSESLVEAREIAKYLNSIPDTEAIVWDQLFPPSSLVFERLESLPSGFSGALFLAAPDYPVTVRGTLENIPNQNVIFEFGLFTGLLGRRRVTLAKHSGTYLSSDLAGFTYIDMSTYPGPKKSHPLSNAIKRSIDAWLNSL